MIFNTLFLVLLFRRVASLPNYLAHRPEFRFPRSIYPTTPVTNDHGEPRLLLTPYISAGNITEAKNLSKVVEQPFSADVPSYSGFLTVNEEFNSNLFFWFFPAQNGYEKAPVILWLQGGPGASSLFGLFEEIGPFTISKNSSSVLSKNPHSWHKNHSLLFIDNPVGTGFSFTDREEGFATNQTQIGAELYLALLQFFALFPELKPLPFYIAGQSYAGKYIPAIGYTIHTKNPTAHTKINLQGLAVGNGFSDPMSMLSRSHFLHQLGLVDSFTYEEMKSSEEDCKKAIENGLFGEALECWYQNVDRFKRESAYSNEYNFMRDQRQDMMQSFDDLNSFLNQDDVRRALHVGDVTFSESGFNVMMNLRNDMMQSVKTWLEELLEHYRVLYYSGQLDIIVAYAMSVRMFNTLQFSASEEYRNATRVPWYVDGELAGYIKSAGKFTEVLVRNAGHMVPTDQPKWAFDLINRFIDGNLLRSRPRTIRNNS